MTGPTGPTGPIGPTGPGGAGEFPGSTIAFSVSKYGTGLSTDENGDPSLITFSGFGGGYYSPEYLDEGEWASGVITIREGMYYPTAFIMPYTAVVKNIYALFSTAYETMFEPGAIIHPFVCLAVSNSNNPVYTILQNTMTITEPYLGGVEYPGHTLRRGALTDLNVTIAEGTVVAIVAGIMAENVATPQETVFSVSGGILLQ